MSEPPKKKFKGVISRRQEVWNKVYAYNFKCEKRVNKLMAVFDQVDHITRAGFVNQTLYFMFEPRVRHYLNEYIHALNLVYPEGVPKNLYGSQKVDKETDIDSTRRAYLSKWTDDILAKTAVLPKFE